MKKGLKKLNIITNIYLFIGFLLWIFASIFIFTPIIPQVWYAFNPQATSNELTSLTQSIEADTKAYVPTQIPPEEPEDLLPKLDKTLPTKNILTIKKIKVSTQIYENKSPLKALQNGPWRASNFGTPDKNDKPIIIASHRWGGIGWSKTDREKKSFYLLPNLVKNDIVEIVWDQRLYKYKIYKSTENTKITDYDADLILYTCKMYWESPIRIFKYAKRVN